MHAIARGKRLALNYYQRFMHANPALDCTIESLNDDRARSTRHKGRWADQAQLQLRSSMNSAGDHL